MIAKRLVNLGGVASAQRADDALVRLDDVGQRLAVRSAKDADEREERNGELVEGAIQRAVVRLTPDAPVELEVGAGLLEVGVAGRGVGEVGQPPIELREAVGRHARRGGRESALFEHEPQLDALADLLWRHPRDVRADVRGADDETQLLELKERLPDCCLADAQVTGQVQLAQRRAGQEPAIEDGGAERVEHSGAERAGSEGLECWGGRHRLVPGVIVIDNWQPVKRDDDWIWLDTTTGVAPYGLLLSEVRGRQVLVARWTAGSAPDHASALVRTPAALPFPFESRIHVSGTVDSLGVLHGHVVETERGDGEAGMRAGLRLMTPAQWNDVAIALAKGMKLSGTITNGKAAHVEGTSEPLAFEFDLRSSGLSDLDNSTLTLPLPAFQFRATDEASWKTRSRLYLGPPLAIVGSTSLTLPAGSIARPPVGVTVSRGPLAYSSSYTIDGHELKAQRTLRVLSSEVLASQSAEYLSFVRAVRADEAQTVVLEYDASAAPIIPEGATHPSCTRREMPRTRRSTTSSRSSSGSGSSRSIRSTTPHSMPSASPTSSWGGEKKRWRLSSSR